MATKDTEFNKSTASEGREEIVSLLASTEFLSAFNRRALDQLAQTAKLKSYKFGDTIVSAGEAGDGLFVIKSGRVRVFNDVKGKESSAGMRQQGDVFGELSVLRSYQHEFSYRASSDVELVYLPTNAFKAPLTANPKAETFMVSYAAIRAAGGFVSQLFELRGKVEAAEIEKLVASVGIKRMPAGSTILAQDSKDDRRLYVIRQGIVNLYRQEQDDEFRLARLEQGEIFGEKACLLRQEQMAQAVAETDCVLLVVPEETVRVILEHNPKLKAVIEDRIRFIDRELARHRRLKERRISPIQLDLSSKPRVGERILKRFPLVEQAEEMDCGAACLTMICKYYGMLMTLGKVRDLVNVTTEGATLDSVARAGESLGFTTRGVKCTYQALKSFEMPFIAHWEGYHFVVVYGLSKHHVWLADPGPGFRKLTVEEFEKGWTGTCLLFAPGNTQTEVVAASSPWARFFNYLKPYKGILGHLFLAALVIQILGLAPPVITQNVLDRVIVHDNTQLLLVLIIGLILSQLFAQITTVMRGLLANYLTRNLDFAMMSAFFKHTLALPVSFFAKRRTGDVMARFQENQTIRTFLTGSTVGTVLNVLMVFVYLTVMFMYNVKLTLLLLGLIIPVFLLAVFITPKMKDYARRTFEASTDAESLLMETVSAAETVKGMGIERPARLKWEKKYANALNVQYDAARFQLLVGFGSQLFNIATTVVILGVGATMVMGQEMSIGQLIAFNMLASSVMTPLMGLVSLWDELHAAGVAMERLGDVLDIEPEQKPEAITSRIILPELRGDIQFENVYFRYGGKETPYVLENVSFDVNGGELVAIVGQSGSGKSTLAKLLVGFYPPTEGKITIDGYDLNLIDMQSYRSQIGYVMQSNLLFQGTVAENIALGVEDPDQRRIIEVAKLADAHGFISNLPLGYEQVVGERGVGLSGGQLQRLCIARALYRDPRLLIFDEATSSLDSQSEGNILNNMQDILDGRTAIVIAHRLSTIMNADKILVLYDGGIVETGRHDELVARKGMYHQLVHKQMATAS